MVLVPAVLLVMLVSSVLLAAVLLGLAMMLLVLLRPLLLVLLRLSPLVVVVLRLIALRLRGSLLRSLGSGSAGVGALLRGLLPALGSSRLHVLLEELLEVDLLIVVRVVILIIVVC